jgi:DNA-binding IclR family transcriptional regulator
MRPKSSKLQLHDIGRRSAMISKSATVVPLREYRAGRRPQFFTRTELNQLLGLYSRNVARGVWRDYAIDHRDGRALFSVFRHTQEAPLYTIVKTAPSAAVPAEFIVMSGRQRLEAGATLGEALEYFRGKLSLVAS